MKAYTHTYTGPSIGHLTEGCPVRLGGIFHGKLMVIVRGPFVHKSDELAYWLKGFDAVSPI